LCGDIKADWMLQHDNSIGGFYAFLLSRDPSVELSVVARSNLEAVKKNVGHDRQCSWVRATVYLTGLQGMTIHTLNHGSHNIHFDRGKFCIIAFDDFMFVKLIANTQY
jgi:hypothetical protein